MQTSLPQKAFVLLAQGKGNEPKLEQVPLTTPGKNQVLVRIEYTPINPSDVTNLKGLYAMPVKPPHPVGFEGSGVVVALGEDLKVQHQVGDKVHVTTVGTFAQYALADSENCRKIQEGLSLEEAASHFVNPCTVASFGHIATTGGHKAIIHTAGASALGRMVIRYFKHKGIKTINIVRRDDIIEELKKDGADYVLNLQSSDFEAKLKEIAQKEEATVAFDALGGDMAGKLLTNMPENSTVYVYGGLGGSAVNGVNVGHLIFQGKTVTGFWLRPYLGKVAKLGQLPPLIQDVYSLLPTVLRSNIQKVFKLEEYKEALAYYEKNSSFGKVLLKPN